MKRTSTLIGGVCIVKDNKILILKESPLSDHKEKWTFPAGHLEGKETILETALRETQEEIGIRPNIKGVVKFGILSDSTRDVTAVFFYAKIKSEKLIKLDKKEISEYRWICLDELKNEKLNWRDPFLKEIAIDSLTKKPVCLDTLIHLIRNR